MNNVGGAGSYFMAVLAGVLLAIGFQFLLTVLSAASGISLIGNIPERVHAAEDNESIQENHRLIKITSGIGIWTLITTCLSLFFASILAVKLTLIDSDQIGAVLGLVIWAAFFLTMLYVEMRSARSILGGIIHTAMTGLRSSSQMLQGVLGKSEAQKTVQAIREELVQTLHDPRLKADFKEYITRLQPSPIDWSKARKEMIKLFSEIEVHATERGGGKIEEETFIRLARRHPHLSKEDIGKLGGVFNEVKESLKNEKGADKVLAVAEKLSPGSAEDTKHVREQVEEYLRHTGVEALNPNSLKEDLNKIVAEPSTAKTVVLNRIKQFDHSTLVSIVSQTTKMPQEEANRIVNRVESAFQSIRENVARRGERSHDGGSNDGGGSMKSSLEDIIRNYFNSLQRPEFDYELMKTDFEQMLHDPKASPTILKERLKSYDRASIIALLESQPNISHEQAEKIVTKIEQARENVIRKIDEIETNVKLQTQKAKELALEQAENVRKTAALAAWWLMATAVLSAGSAALGGALAFS